jgi:hypothetical protein
MQEWEYLFAYWGRGKDVGNNHYYIPIEFARDLW